jgi:hypothetical protein
MKFLPSETDMQRYRDRHRIGWGIVASLIVMANSDALAGAVEFVLVLAAALLGGFLGGVIYSWTWRLRSRAYVEEALAPLAGVITYTDHNWGPLWRKLRKRIIGWAHRFS